MKRARWMILYCGNQLRIRNLNDHVADFVTIECPEGNSHEHAVRQVIEAVSKESAQPADVVLGVSSEYCLSATFSHDGPAMARQQKTMEFALEEYMPLAAEDFVADFVVHDKDVLGVALETESLSSFVDDLQDSGITVVAVVPTAFLALQTLLAGRKVDGVAALCDREHIDLVQIGRGQPLVWRSIPKSSDSLSVELALMGNTVGDEITLLCDAGADEDPLGCVSKGSAGIERSDVGIEDAATVTAGRILDGSLRPWVNLCQGRLVAKKQYRPLMRHQRMLIASTVLMFVAVLVAANIRANQYRQSTKTFQSEMRQLFRETFPGQRVPTGIHSRFESEVQRLAGMTGQISDIPRLPCALILLHETIARLPTDMRYRLVEIRLGDDRVYLDGEVRQHGDADRLAAALRGGGLEVSPPRTESLASKGVSVTISAALEYDEHGTRIAENPSE